MNMSVVVFASEHIEAVCAIAYSSRNRRHPEYIFYRFCTSSEKPLRSDVQTAPFFFQKILTHNRVHQVDRECAAQRQQWEQQRSAEAAAWQQERVRPGPGLFFDSWEFMVYFAVQQKPQRERYNCGTIFTLPRPLFCRPPPPQMPQRDVGP